MLQLGVVLIALFCTATATVRDDGYIDGTSVEQSVKEVSTCNNEDCDAECRSIGCARGLCAGDDCYCDIWRNINEIKQSRNSTAAEKNIKALICDKQVCDQKCRRHGFRDGWCMDDHCTCTKHYLKLRDNISGIKRTIKDLSKCNELECYQECIKFGYISGTCVGNTCTCKIRLSEVFGIKRTIMDLNKCNELECYQECIKFGYISGTCVGNTCTCKIRLSEEMTIAKDVKNLKYCWDNQCDLECSEHGYISGRCIDNDCTCKLFRETISKIEDNEVMSNEITRCTQYTCRSVCQDLGHTGGKCFHGKCKCNIKLGPLFQVLINDDSEKKDVSVVAN